MQHPLVLVGNALSLMVAATRLAREGKEVTIINGSRNWGGHFSTVSCDGVAFDAGLVVHEFTSFNVAAGDTDPRTYDPSVKYDATRFLKTIREYVEGYQSTAAIATPQMHVEGRFHDDILISNALAALPQLSFADDIARDLATLSQETMDSPLHASRKHAGDTFARVGFEPVSLANHGNAFHTRIIEPFCRKLIDCPTRDVVALFHRAAWLPLYYPETLLSLLRGAPTPLPATVFNYPVGERVGDLSARLKVEIDGNALITVVNERPVRVHPGASGGFEIDFTERSGMAARKLAWAGAPGDLLQALGHGDRAGRSQRCSIALSFLQIPTAMLRRDFTTVSIVDPELACYRITNQTRCSAIDSPLAHIVVEFNPVYASALGVAEADFDRWVAEELSRLGIVEDPGSVAVMKTLLLTNAFMLPNAANMAASRGETSFLQGEHPDLALLGPASGFFTSSFNDQIIQGLRLAALWVE